MASWLDRMWEAYNAAQTEQEAERAGGGAVDTVEEDGLQLAQWRQAQQHFPEYSEPDVPVRAPTPTTPTPDSWWDLAQKPDGGERRNRFDLEQAEEARASRPFAFRDWLDLEAEQKRKKDEENRESAALKEWADANPWQAAFLQAGQNVGNPLPMPVPQTMNQARAQNEANWTAVGNTLSGTSGAIDATPLLGGIKHYGGEALRYGTNILQYPVGQGQMNVEDAYATLSDADKATVEKYFAELDARPKLLPGGSMGIAPGKGDSPAQRLASLYTTNRSEAWRIANEKDSPIGQAFGNFETNLRAEAGKGLKPGETVQERLTQQVNTFEQRTPMATQIVVGFVDPSNLVIGLPFRGAAALVNGRRLAKITPMLNELDNGASIIADIKKAGLGSKDAARKISAVQDFALRDARSVITDMDELERVTQQAYHSGLKPKITPALQAKADDLVRKAIAEGTPEAEARAIGQRFLESQATTMERVPFTQLTRGQQWTELKRALNPIELLPTAQRELMTNRAALAMDALAGVTKQDGAAAVGDALIQLVRDPQARSVLGNVATSKAANDLRTLVGKFDDKSLRDMAAAWVTSPEARIAFQDRFAANAARLFPTPNQNWAQRVVMTQYKNIASKPFMAWNPAYYLRNYYTNIVDGAVKEGQGLVPNVSYRKALADMEAQGVTPTRGGRSGIGVGEAMPRPTDPFARAPVSQANAPQLAASPQGIFQRGKQWLKEGGFLKSSSDAEAEARTTFAWTGRKQTHAAAMQPGRLLPEDFPERLIAAGLNESEYNAVMTALKHNVEYAAFVKDLERILPTGVLPGGGLKLSDEAVDILTRLESNGAVGFWLSSDLWDILKSERTSTGQKVAALQAKRAELLKQAQSASAVDPAVDNAVAKTQAQVVNKNVQAAQSAGALVPTQAELNALRTKARSPFANTPQGVLIEFGYNDPKELAKGMENPRPALEDILAKLEAKNPNHPDIPGVRQALDSLGAKVEPVPGKGIFGTTKLDASGQPVKPPPPGATAVPPPITKPPMPKAEPIAPTNVLPKPPTAPAQRTLDDVIALGEQRGVRGVKNAQGEVYPIQGQHALLNALNTQSPYGVADFTFDNLPERLDEAAKLLENYVPREARTYAEKMARDQFAVQARNAFKNLTDDELQAGIAVTEARARQWAKEAPGRKVEDFYGKTYAALEKGEPVTGALKAQKGARGSSTFLADSRAVIRATRSADATTFVHESAHAWLRGLPEKDIDLIGRASGLKPLELKDLHDAFIVGEFNLTSKPGRAYKQAQEFFAESVEKYLHEGVAPTKELKTVFEKFKTWLTDIYHGIVGTPLEREMSDDVRGALKRMLGGEEEKVVGTTFTAKPAPIGQSQLVKPGAPLAKADLGALRQQAIKAGVDPMDADFASTADELNKLIAEVQGGKVKPFVPEVKKGTAIDKAVSVPRNKLNKSLSENMAGAAREMQDALRTGEPGKRVFLHDTDQMGGTARVLGIKSSYPDWYGTLIEKYKVKKETVDNALNKIVLDAGKDKGLTVERVKQVILEELAKGFEGMPPDPHALALLGAPQAEIDAAYAAWKAAGYEIKQGNALGRFAPRAKPLPLESNALLQRTKKPIPGQVEMFGATNEDLPLFSGTAQKAEVSPFKPVEQAQQGRLEGISTAPEFGAGKKKAIKTISTPEGERTLFQSANPLRGVDPVAPPHPAQTVKPQAQALAKEIDALIAAIRNPPAPSGAVDVLAKRQAVEQALNNIGLKQRYAESAALSSRVGEMNANFILHDYTGDRRNFDTWISYLIPWNFWYTREGWTYAQTLARDPKWLRAYIQYQNGLAEINDGLPDAYKDKIPLGNRLFLDATRAFIPFASHAKSLDGLMQFASGDEPTYQKNVVDAFEMSYYPGMEYLYNLSGLPGSRPLNAQEKSGQIGQQTAQARFITGATAMAKQAGLPGDERIPAGGWRPESFVTEGTKPLLGLSSNDYFDTGRVADALAEMYQQQEITLAQYNQAMNAQSGEVWDKAKTNAAARGFIPEATRDLTGIAVREMPASTPAILDAKKDWDMLQKAIRAFPGGMNKDMEQSLYDLFEAKYPWYGAYRNRYDTTPERMQSGDTSGYFNAVDQAKADRDAALLALPTGASKTQTDPIWARYNAAIASAQTQYPNAQTQSSTPQPAQDQLMQMALQSEPKWGDGTQWQGNYAAYQAAHADWMSQLPQTSQSIIEGSRGYLRGAQPVQAQDVQAYRQRGDSVTDALSAAYSEWMNQRSYQQGRIEEDATQNWRKSALAGLADKPTEDELMQMVSRLYGGRFDENTLRQQIQQSGILGYAERTAQGKSKEELDRQATFDALGTAPRGMSEKMASDVDDAMARLGYPGGGYVDSWYKSNGMLKPDLAQAFKRAVDSVVASNKWKKKGESVLTQEALAADKFDAMKQEWDKATAGKSGKDKALAQRLLEEKYGKNLYDQFWQNEGERMVSQGYDQIAKVPPGKSDDFWTLVDKYANAGLIAGGNKYGIANVQDIWNNTEDKATLGTKLPAIVAAMEKAANDLKFIRPSTPALREWAQVENEIGVYMNMPKDTGAQKTARREYWDAHPLLAKYYSSDNKTTTSAQTAARGGGGGGYASRSSETASRGTPGQVAQAQLDASLADVSDGELKMLIGSYFREPVGQRDLFARRYPKLAFWLSQQTAARIAQLTALFGTLSAGPSSRYVTQSPNVPIVTRVMKRW